MVICLFVLEYFSLFCLCVLGLMQMLVFPSFWCYRFINLSVYVCVERINVVYVFIMLIKSYEFDVSHFDHKLSFLRKNQCLVDADRLLTSNMVIGTTLTRSLLHPLNQYFLQNVKNKSTIFILTRAKEIDLR